jgi:hypothetical protein
MNEATAQVIPSCETYPTPCDYPFNQMAALMIFVGIVLTLVTQILAKSLRDD